MPLLESMLLSVFANPSQNWTFQRFTRVAEVADSVYIYVCVCVYTYIERYTHAYIYSIVIFHICMSLFESTLLSFCKPQYKNTYIYKTMFCSSYIYIHIHIYIYNIMLCMH